MLLAEQLVHQRFVHPGPLVLRATPLKFPAPATDRDRTVSRRSELIVFKFALKYEDNLKFARRGDGFLESKR